MGVLVLVVLVLSLPVHDLFRYALLVVAAAVVFTGRVRRRPGRWIAALAVALAAVGALTLWSAPRIDEGYNFYFDSPRPDAALALPPDVSRAFAAAFTATYPAAARCDRSGFPPAPHDAFSADAIYEHPILSRRVTGIAFSDPAQLRLGDINKGVYNRDIGACGITRFNRDRRSLALFDRYRLLYPLYLVYRFPAVFAGSDLCWRGTVLWPHGKGHYDTIAHATTACRPIAADDIGRDIYAAAIKPGLAMHLRPTASVTMRRAFEDGLTFIGVIGILALLVEWRPRRLRLPALIVALSLLVTVFVDASFIGGLRPLDDADDGFTYEGFARQMVHQVLAGDIAGALEGGERVYYFTPGFRYFRTLERFAFGDTYLGYLSAMLALPFVVLALFRRFLDERWALVTTLLFVATPLGALFGSSLLHYIVWAARGFADPLAFFFLFAGTLLLVPKRSQVAAPPAAPAFFGALLLATAAFCRPNLVLAGGALAASAFLMAAAQRRWARAAATAAGFAALAVSPLHNIVYGHSLVPFSDNVDQARTLLMSPLDYLRALGELARLDVFGPHVVRAVKQLAAWLSGPSELLVMVPLHAAAVAILVRVGLLGARFDPWLRVVALATLLQHGIGVCYVNSARYNLGTWLLTTLVCAAWLTQEGLPLIARKYPGLVARWQERPGVKRLERGVRGLQSLAS